LLFFDRLAFEAFQQLSIPLHCCWRLLVLTLRSVLPSWLSDGFNGLSDAPIFLRHPATAAKPLGDAIYAHVHAEQGTADNWDADAQPDAETQAPTRG
jgi:hypothetical protein